jgi:multiple sugar transport system substrate-binding protein
MTRITHRINRRHLVTGSAGLAVGAGLAGALRMPAALAQDTANLEFWDMVWGPPEYIDTGTSMTEQFSEDNPDIQVEYRSTPWSNWYQTFATAIGAGTAPDVSTGAGYQAVQFYDQGAIAALDDLIADFEADGSLDDFLPGTIDRMRYDDHYVAMPWAIDIRIPYYRKDIFEEVGIEPPTTWDEFAEAAKAVTTDDRYGFVSAGADNMGSHNFYVFLLNNGGSLFTEDGGPNLMDERNIEAAQFFSDLVKAGSVHPASVGYVGDDALKAFSQGNAAMIINNPGMWERFPEIEDQIGILPPLKGPHGDTGTISWVNNVMMYEQSENKDAVRTFMKWWSENALPLWTEGHVTQLPVRQSLADDAFFTGNERLKYILDEWVPIARTTGYPVEGIFPALNEVEGEGVMQTLAQDILQGKDVQESMERANDRFEEIVSG